MGKYMGLAAGLLFGLLLIIGAIASFFEIRITRSWPTAVGTIQDSKLFRKQSQIWVELEYTYEVGGETYSKKNSIAGEAWQEVPSDYLPSSEIVVYYNPHKHDRSVLVHAGYESPIALAIFGGVVWVACAPFVFWYGLLICIDRWQRQAQYHLREALQDIGDAQNIMDAMRSRGEEIPDELGHQESEVLSAANLAYAILKENELRRRSLDR